MRWFIAVRFRDARLRSERLERLEGFETVGKCPGNPFAEPCVIGPPMTVGAKTVSGDARKTGCKHFVQALSVIDFDENRT